MVLDHRELPLVNSVTSLVAGGGWWRKRKGRLIYVVVAGRGFELGSYCIKVDGGGGRRGRG
jgi:hypothetical protein